jgi:hypothetical protein
VIAGRLGVAVISIVAACPACMPVLLFGIGAAVCLQASALLLASTLMLHKLCCCMQATVIHCVSCCFLGQSHCNNHVPVFCCIAAAVSVLYISWMKLLLLLSLPGPHSAA